MPMQLASIQSRLTLLLITFFMLVVVSVGATFWSLENQKRDASIINLAGRQRMLVQQMTREALEIGMAQADPNIQMLQESIQNYELTLQALINGGEAPYQPAGSVTLPAAQDPKLVKNLNEVELVWQDYRGNLQVILTQPASTPAFKAALQQVESLSIDLVQKSDAVVRLYEAASNQKVVRLRWIQIIFLGSALLLLAVGAWMVRNNVVNPLHDLGQAAKRIGGGDLSTPVEVDGLEEIELLENNFNQMRAQLQDSREQSLVWMEQLEQKVAQRTQELEALYTVSREISSRLSIEDVLCSITQKTKELLNCDVAFLCVLNEPGQTMSLISSSGPDGAIARHNSPVDSTTAGRVLASDRALRCDQGCRGYCEIVAAPYRTSHIAAPLKIEQQIIGALCVGSMSQNEFGEDAANALTKLANVAAVALQNARLYNQAERLATSEERQRIAAEMHDGLAQTLSYTKLIVNQAALQLEAGQVDIAMQTLENVNSALNQAIEDIRRAIASLQEQGPLTESLQEQLEALVMEFTDDDPKVEWSSKVQAPVMLSRQVSQQVQRVAKEALLNARRHSHASRISLCLDQIDGDYCLCITDNGQGFDSNTTISGNGQQHFGLNIMHARAARISGNLNINSIPGKGTEVTLAWPARSAAR